VEALHNFMYGFQIDVVVLSLSIKCSVLCHVSCVADTFAPANGDPNKIPNG
jgi:hypothetical protein